MLPAAFRPMMLHDSFWIDHVWASQFTALLREGVVYPRWLPWSHEGLGSPVFYYYPPLAFYLAGAFGLAGLSTYASILATFYLAFFVSGVGAWHWLRDRTQYPLLGALFFTLAPYHCFDFYGRGALAESVAIALLPLLAIGLRRIAEGRGWAPAATAYAAIIVSHLPLALLASLFLITPYALYRRHLTGFIISCAIGLGLSAIYLLPALGLEPFRDSAQLWVSAFLRPGFWTITAANWQVPVVAYFHLTVAVLAVPALIFAIWSRNRWAIYALAILAISLGLIPFLWSLPLLRDVQFPYRILPLAELGLAAAFAGRAPFSMALRIAALALPLVWMGVLMQVPRANAPDRAAVEQRHLDVREYLPAGTPRDGGHRHWLEHPRQGRIPPPSVKGWVVEPFFYFPAWSCGQPEPSTKLLMHRPGCEPRLGMTSYERIGTLVSLLALLVLLFQLMLAKRERAARISTNGP
jgi:hypothetical protein